MAAPLRRELAHFFFDPGLGVAAGLRAGQSGQPIQVPRWIGKKHRSLVELCARSGTLVSGSDDLVFSAVRSVFSLVALSPIFCLTAGCPRVRVLVRLVAGSVSSPVENRGQLDKRLLRILFVHTGGVPVPGTGGGGSDGYYLGGGKRNIRAFFDLGADQSTTLRPTRRRETVPRAR